MMFPLVTECARNGIAVTVSCRVLGFSRQAYYRWLADPVCQRDWDDAHLTNRLVDAHADDPAFGYRLLADEVNAAGRVASENRVHWSAATRSSPRPRCGVGGARADPDPPSTTTSSDVTSVHPDRTGSGSPTSPSTRRPRARSTSAR